MFFEFLGWNPLNHINSKNIFRYKQKEHLRCDVLEILETLRRLNIVMKELELLQYISYLQLFEIRKMINLIIRFENPWSTIWCSEQSLGRHWRIDIENMLDIDINTSCNVISSYSVIVHR